MSAFAEKEPGTQSVPVRWQKRAWTKCDASAIRNRDGLTSWKFKIRFDLKTDFLSGHGLRFDVKKDALSGHGARCQLKANSMSGDGLRLELQPERPSAQGGRQRGHKNRPHLLIFAW